MILKFKDLYNINGRMTQLIFTTLHFSRLLTKISRILEALRVRMLFVVLEIQSQLIIFHQQETFQRNHLLQDSYSKREFNKLISILMVPGEETMKSWPEVHLQIQESSTS